MLGNAVVSWTGGKDGCYSCYKAMLEGWQVNYLLHFRRLSGPGSHDINPDLIRAQSEAAGIPLIQRDFTSYEEEFKRTIRDLRAGGEKIEGAVFGHIQTHKRLTDRICRDLKLRPLLPLWQQDREMILQEIIGSGFEVVLVGVRDDLGRGWLGRRIDEDLLDELKDLNQSIDLCGENGEFHTLVTDGPIFKKRIVISESEQSFREGYWFLNIAGYSLQAKRNACDICAL